ncbi:MAG: penicillin-binding protein 2, partial [Desulfobulbaceae bacterium]|nr:penicillin-binding protein 2 [Desulfobulbaceae bacterium]
MSRFLTSIHKIDEAELNTLKRRIDIATAVAIFFIAILVVRLWYLQIQRGDDYAQLSENNRIRAQDLSAPRGNIIDRQGRIIVTNRPCFNIVWVREDAPNPDAVLKKLAHILHEDISVLLERIRSSADHPRYMPFRLREDIDWRTLVYIENLRLDLPGVRIEVLPNREYRHGNLASHLIGYLGQINPKELEKHAQDNYAPDDRLGKQGIEKLHEKQLRGEKGRKYLEVDVHGFEQRQIRTKEPLPGDDLQLTIDIDLQEAAEKAMKGKAGAVVAMDVNSGKMLVLASTPPMQLDEFVGGISTKAWKAMLNNPMHPLINKAIQGQYPPGSTYKIITALAGLNEGIVTPDTIVYCNGSYTFGNRKYGCWKKTGHGPVNMRRALKESCDVYFYQLGQKLGVKTLAKYAQNLGLGTKTGITLENEKPGLTPTDEWKRKRHKESWQEGETLSVAIGQGFNLATPLQVCRMTATIANGGILFRPQLLEAITDPDGKQIEPFSPIIDGHALGQPEQLALIRDALKAVVNEQHGTGNAARLKNISVGGKTGTAQVIHLSKYQDANDEDIPYKYRDHAWFTCFAPTENPEIAVTVLIEHGGHGGSAAG